MVRTLEIDIINLDHVAAAARRPLDLRSARHPTACRHGQRTQPLSIYVGQWHFVGDTVTVIHNVKETRPI